MVNESFHNPVLQSTVIMLVQEFFFDTLVCRDVQLKALKTFSIFKMADVYLKKLESNNYLND